MFNKVILMGRLVADPELRQTPSNISVCRFRIAVDRGFQSNNGERQADFISIVAWRQSAEFVSKYFSKGRLAAVDGRLQIREWTDKDGNKRRSAEIVVNNIYFGDSRRDNTSDNSYSSGYGPSSSNSFGGQQASPAPHLSDNPFGEISDDDGELPF